MNLDQYWRPKCDGFPTSSNLRFKYATWYLKLVASFIEWLLKNVETLETLVVVFEYLCCSDDATWFEELLRMLPTLSNNNNVSIILRIYPVRKLNSFFLFTKKIIDKNAHQII